MLKLLVCVVAALALVIASVGPVSAQPAGRVKVGTLACQLSPSVDYVVGSRQALTCRFNPVVPRPPDVYVGAIKTAGLDIGVKTGGAMLRSSHPLIDIIEGRLRDLRRSEWRRRDRV